MVRNNPELQGEDDQFSACTRSCTKIFDSLDLAHPFGGGNRATFEHLYASSLSYRIVLQLQERKCNFPAIETTMLLSF